MLVRFCKDTNFSLFIEKKIMKKKVILKESDIVKIIKGVLNEWWEYPPDQEDLPYCKVWMPSFFVDITKERLEELQKADWVRNLEIDPDSEPERNCYGAKAEIYMEGDLVAVNSYTFENDKEMYETIVNSFDFQKPGDFEYFDYSDYGKYCDWFEYDIH